MVEQSYKIFNKVENEKMKEEVNDGKERFSKL